MVRLTTAHTLDTAQCMLMNVIQSCSRSAPVGVDRTFVISTRIKRRRRRRRSSSHRRRRRRRRRLLSSPAGQLAVIVNSRQRRPNQQVCSVRSKVKIGYLAIALFTRVRVSDVSLEALYNFGSGSRLAA